MKTLLTLIMCAAISIMGMAQTISGDAEIKTGRAAGNTAEKKLKKASKRIFINEFRVFYQVVYFDSDYARAGYDGGGASGHRGAASASLSVALNGVDESALTENTTKLYNEYIAELKKQGYEIVSIDEAAKTSPFEEYQKMEGGKLNTAQMPGYLMSTPTGFSYMIKKVTASGKEKKKFFPQDHKVSFELGEVIVANVNLYIPFMEESESGGSKMLKGAVGGLAKVVASPYFRLEADKTTSSYQFASNKFGPEAYAAMPMKKNLEIEGVFDRKQKFKSTAKAENNQAYDNGAWTIVIPADDVKTSNVQFLNCDSKMYVEGTYKACKKYLDATMAQFKEFTN